MKQLRNQKGFTLIELAIVLVIIGIILGAVLKGKDLIENARAKKFINDVRQFEVLSWTFFDRKGYFPGDGDKNGIIGDNNGNPYDDIVNKGKLTDVPTTNAITIGSYTFYVWFGNDGSKNIIAVTNKNDTPGVFSDAELAYMEAFDTAVDGTVDPGVGRVRSATGGTLTSSKWLISGTLSINSTTSSAWPTTATALVYYFDRAK